MLCSVLMGRLFAFYVICIQNDHFIELTAYDPQRKVLNKLWQWKGAKLSWFARRSREKHCFFFIFNFVLFNHITLHVCFWSIMVLLHVIYFTSIDFLVNVFSIVASILHLYGSIICFIFHSIYFLFHINRVFVQCILNSGSNSTFYCSITCLYFSSIDFLVNVFSIVASILHLNGSI